MQTPLSGLLSMYEQKVPKREGTKEAVVSAAIYVIALSVGQDTKGCFVFAYTSSLLTWIYYKIVELPMLERMCREEGQALGNACEEQLAEHRQLAGSYLRRLHVFIITLAVPLLLLMLQRKRQALEKHALKNAHV